MNKDYMNNIRFKEFLICWFLISISIISCQKDVIDEFTPLDERWTSLDSFFSNAEKIKRISIPNAEDEFVVSSNGLYYHFLGESLLNEDNSKATGEATLEIKEIRKTGDYILNQIDSETYDGESMFPEAIFSLRLVKNGEELKLKDKILIYQETSNSEVDLEVTTEWIDDNTNDGWFPTVSLDVFNHSWDFDINTENFQGAGFKMYLRKLGWFQMGSYANQVYPSGDVFGTVEVEIPTEFAIEDVKVFLAYKDRLCLLPSTRIDNKFKFKQVIKAEEVEVIMLTVKEDKLYFGKKHFITENESEVTLNTIEKTDFVSLIAFLQDL